MGKGRKQTLTLVALITAVLLLVGVAYANTMIMPTGLVTIDDESFSNDSSITRVVVAEGTKQIKGKAFAYSGIRELILPDSITYIDSSAFTGCGSIDVFAEAFSYGYERIKTLMANGYMKGNLYEIFTMDEDNYVYGGMAAGEKFFISFTAPTAGTYSFYGVSSVGTYLDIYNIHGTNIGIDSSSYDGKNYYLTRTMAKGERVFLRTKLDSPTATGYMESHVEKGTAPKPVTITAGTKSITVPAKGYTRYMFTPTVGSWYDIETLTSLNGYISITWPDTGVKTRSNEDADGCDYSMQTYLDANKTVFIDVYNNSSSSVTRTLSISRSIYKLYEGEHDYYMDAGENCYYKFTAARSAKYTFYSTGSQDTYATLYDSSMTKIATSDNDGDGNNFSITYDMYAGESVILDAKFKDTKYDGDMTIVVQEYNVTTYRALLIAQVDFSWDLAYRNLGDVNDMISALRSVNEDYAITAKQDLSKSQVRSAIANTFSGADSNDVSLFFYASHGQSSGKGTEDYGALCTYLDEKITTAEITSWLKAIPGKVIVIVGTCGSGALIKNEDGEVVESFDPDAFNSAIISAFAAADPGLVVDDPDAAVENSESNSAEMALPKFYVLTAADAGENSRGYEVELDPSQSRNIFGLALYNGIGAGAASTMKADSNSNKQLTLNELYVYSRSYIRNYFSSNPSKIFYPQVYPANSSYVLFTK